MSCDNELICNKFNTRLTKDQSTVTLKLKGLKRNFSDE